MATVVDARRLTARDGRALLVFGAVAAAAAAAMATGTLLFGATWTASEPPHRVVARSRYLTRGALDIGYWKAWVDVPRPSDHGPCAWTAVFGRPERPRAREGTVCWTGDVAGEVGPYHARPVDDQLVVVGLTRASVAAVRLVQQDGTSTQVETLPIPRTPAFRAYAATLRSVSGPPAVRR